MAEHLASIFGTEKDRVNCPFYFKIGACRHGDRCSRLHNRPTISPTLLLSNMYQRPDSITPGLDPQGQAIDPQKIQEHFEDFYEDLFEELSKFGEIETLNICDNLADHMVGNVYAQFKEEDQAAAALQALQGRFYSGRPIIADFSPVTDFREATCRQFEEDSCNRGGYCNFMHVKQIGRELRRKLFGRYRKFQGRRSRSRSRSRSPRRREHRENGDYRGRGRRSGGHRDSNFFSLVGAELAVQEGASAAALATCRTLAEELSEHRFPAPRILACKEGSSQARYFVSRLIPAHKDPPYEQLLLLIVERRQWKFLA